MAFYKQLHDEIVNLVDESDFNDEASDCHEFNIENGRKDFDEQHRFIDHHDSKSVGEVLDGVEKWIIETYSYGKYQEIALKYDIYEHDSSLLEYFDECKPQSWNCTFKQFLANVANKQYDKYNEDYKKLERLNDEDLRNLVKQKEGLKKLSTKWSRQQLIERLIGERVSYPQDGLVRVVGGY
jgi:hypothetical protein